jgi:SAM-dependent methyltransferase
MARHVCPWWIGYFLLSPVRRWGQDPQKILKPHVEPGMTVADIGCAMGFFTLDLARLVGDEGRVVAVDLQERMLRTMEKRARRAGLNDRIETRGCAEDGLGLDDLAGGIDFALAFAVAHEVPDQGGFLEQIHTALRPGSHLLLAEPAGHVTEDEFNLTLDAADHAGFEIVSRPTIRRSRTVLLQRA